MPTPLPAGTVTFLFTDIEGSTKLLQRLGDAYAQVLRDHQALLRAAFAAHGGVEVDTEGDAFFVAFPVASQAVAAAAAGMQALAAYPWPEGITLRVRMGLHTGTAQVVGDHYVGLDVHRAARIAATGHGGQVVVSQSTVDLVSDALPTGVSLRDLGAHRLKDLPHPEHLYQLVLPGLPNDFPPLKSLDAHPNSLPIQPTELLGRAEAVAAVTALLRQAGTRLVTLTGPGGVGKTRLSLQVAAEQLEARTDGVWFVRLASLTDPALVIPTIAHTLHLRESGTQPIAEVLVEYLERKHLLLVLDNFEQVVTAAPEISTLLAHAPGLTVLVTSRTPLHLRGEREYPLAPLDLPDSRQRLPVAQLAEYPSVALFVERAQAVRPSFALTAANALAVADICIRLDGLPLAIELAAARIKLLTPEALLLQLTRSLTSLGGGARDLDARQRTLRGVIAWSEDLLTPEERTLFQRLAIFVGGATLEAVEAVCLAPEGAAPLDLDTLEGVGALVDQSLVQQREEDGESWFVMLRVIREYALERLEASGEAAALHRAHATWGVALVEQSRGKLTGPEATAWLHRLEREHGNLRAALGWLRDDGEIDLGLHLAGILSRFWKVRGHFREGQAWIEAMLAADAGHADATMAPPQPAQVRARALLNGGTLALEAGDYATAETWTDQARVLALAAGELAIARQALTNMGLLAMDYGDLERAAAQFRESLALARELSDQHGIALVLNNLAEVTLQQGDYERAAALWVDALALARQMGDRDLIALCLNNLGRAARMRGDVAQAEALSREALILYREVGNPSRCAKALESLADTAVVAGHGVRGARLLGAAAAIRESIGAPPSDAEPTDIEPAVAAARSVLGEEAWAAAFAAGQTLTLEEAISEALGEDANESA